MKTKTTQVTKHTPLPWVPGEGYEPQVLDGNHQTQTPGWVGIGGNGAALVHVLITGCVPLAIARANRDLIIRAVNAHEELVEALTMVAEVGSLTSAEWRSLRAVLKKAVEDVS